MPGGFSRFQLAILGSVAEYERERIRERIQAGIDARMREGGWVSGRTPFGYRLVKDRASKQSRLVVDRKQATAIRMIFDQLITERRRYTEVMDNLNRAKLWTGAGLPWSRPRFSDWVRSSGFEAAGGLVQLEGRTLPVEPILSAKEVMEWRSWLDATSRVIAPPDERILSGRVIGLCGQKLVSQGGQNKSRAYLCPRTAGRRGCGDQRVRASFLDEFVWAQVVSTLTDPAALAAAVAATEQASGGKAELAAARKRVRELQEEVTLRYRGLRDGHGLGTEQAIEQMSDARDALVNAQRLVGRLSSRQDDQPPLDDVVLVRRAVEGNLEEMSAGERRALLQALDVKVHIGGYRDCAGCVGSGRARTTPGAGMPPAPCPRCLGSKRFADPVSIAMAPPISIRPQAMSIP